MVGHVLNPCSGECTLENTYTYVRNKKGTHSDYKEGRAQSIFKTFLHFACEVARYRAQPEARDVSHLLIFNIKLNFVFVTRQTVHAQSNAGELILRNLQSDDPSFHNNLIISFSIIDLIIFPPTSI